MAKRPKKSPVPIGKTPPTPRFPRGRQTLRPIENLFKRFWEGEQ